MNKMFLISWDVLCLFSKFAEEITATNIYKQSGKIIIFHWYNISKIQVWESKRSQW